LSEKNLLEFVELLANKSEEVILPFYESGTSVEKKADNSPVTIADQKTEEELRKLIEIEFPDHCIQGEEFGISGNENAEFKWILDPIDGTKSFIHKVPLFGTLIALLKDGKPFIGCINIPCLKERMIGVTGKPTTLNGQIVTVSTQNQLSESLVLTTCEKDTLEKTPGYLNLAKSAQYARTWGDCYGHLMVAAGRAEVMADPIVNIWDVAALKPCIEGAGGMLTDLNGDSGGLGESAISTNGQYHSEVLKILNS